MGNLREDYFKPAKDEIDTIKENLDWHFESQKKYSLRVLC
jgi:hypothetical protein